MKKLTLILLAATILVGIFSNVAKATVTNEEITDRQQMNSIIKALRLAIETQNAEDLPECTGITAEDLKYSVRGSEIVNIYKITFSSFLRNTSRTIITEIRYRVVVKENNTLYDRNFQLDPTFRRVWRAYVRVSQNQTGAVNLGTIESPQFSVQTFAKVLRAGYCSY